MESHTIFLEIGHNRSCKYRVNQQNGEHPKWTVPSHAFTGSPVAYYLALTSILGGTEAASYPLVFFVRGAFAKFPRLRAAILTRHYLADYPTANSLTFRCELINSEMPIGSVTFLKTPVIYPLFHYTID